MINKDDKLILSLDVGGTYIKAALYDLNGSQIGLEKHYNHLISDRPDHTEYDPDELWETSCMCMSDVMANTCVDPKRVIAIGISAQGSGCYFMGENGETVRNFISSADRRAVYITNRWREQGLEKELYPYIYRNSSSGHTNAIMAWLKENESENFKKMRWHFAMKDYLVYRLTGNIISGRGCMSCSGLMNLQTGTFDATLAEKQGMSGVEKLFGPLRWDTEIGGLLSVEAAQKCGCNAGIPVACGSHDVIATAFAMGCIDAKYCFVIMGTCSINGYISPNPILDGSIRFNEIFAIPGHYLIEQPGSASSSVLEWVINVLFDRKARTAGEIYDEINNIVESVSPDSSKLIFIPYLRGKYENPNTLGAWIGLDSTHTKAQMLMAVYEAVVFAHIEELNRLFKNRERPEMINLGGGATNSPVWVQLFADALGIPVQIVPKAEMGCKGAAIIAAIASGVFPDAETAISAMTRLGQIIHPRKEYEVVYKEKYERFEQVCAKMNEIWDVL